MRFWRDGAVAAPMKAYAIWFMAQYVRLGHLQELPDVKALSEAMVLSDLYAEVASEMKVAVPTDMTPFEVALDKTTFDPNKPEQEAKRS
jgi:nitrate/nitrite transport system substrate-binding protein